MLLRGCGERQSESSCRVDERRVEETWAQDEHSTDDQRMPWAMRSLERGEHLFRQVDGVAGMFTRFRPLRRSIGMEFVK